MTALLRIVVLTVLLAVSGLMMTPATAEDPASRATTWGIAPAHDGAPDGRAQLNYVLEPGETFEDEVHLRNYGHEDLLLHVYAADALTTPVGGFDLRAGDEPVREAGGWVAVEKDQVVLPPRGGVTVPVRIRVPKDAEPGDHAAGIVASVTAQSEGTGVDVERRVGTRVYVRITGEVEPALSAGIDDAGFVGGLWPPGRTEVDLTTTNSGNIRLSGTTSVTVSGPFGWGGRTVPAGEVENLLPGTRLRRDVHVAGTWPWGWQRITVTTRATESAGQDLDLAADSATTTVIAVPWGPLVVIVVAVIGGALLVRKRRRRPSSGVRSDHGVHRSAEPGP